MLDKLLHRYLHIPYILHVREHRRVKDPKGTILLLHGLGDTGRLWDPIIEKLPNTHRVITIDLLGFGKSPKPLWAELNTKIQAHAVAATLLRLGVFGKVTVVGHSMGALIAIEFAKRHPRLVTGVILCSPPFYRPIDGRFRLLTREEQLKRLYRSILNHPQSFLSLVNFAMRYKFISDTHEITADNIDTYISALESSILKQTSLDDAKKLHQPVRILHGVFDPVVIRSHLVELIKSATRANIKHIFAGHEIRGPYIRAIVNAIEEMTQKQV